jgi:hypothetical protein
MYSINLVGNLQYLKEADISFMEFPIAQLSSKRSKPSTSSATQNVAGEVGIIGFWYKTEGTFVPLES